MENNDFDGFIQDLINKSKEEISKYDNGSIPVIPVKGIPPEVQRGIILSLIKKNDISNWIVANESIFKKFMTELFNSSLHVEEGMQVCIRVALALPDREPNIKFTSPLPFEAKRIVKIAPSIKLCDRHILVKSDDTGALKIYGFLQKPYSGWRSIDDRAGGQSNSTPFLSIEVHGPGEIRLDHPLYCEYNKGRVEEFSDFNSIESINEWLIDIGLQIDKWQETPTYVESNRPSSSRGMLGAHFFKSTLSNILRYMREGKHGGCLAIVPEEREGWSQSIELNDYEVKSEYLMEALEKRFKSKPAQDLLSREYYGPKNANLPFEKNMSAVDLAKEIDNLHFSERELEQAESFISSLSYVDGAVVLSRDLNLIGFGARFTAKLESESEVKNVGMRHKSAHDFCCKAKDSIAIVVSQDGGITVFSNNGKDSCNREEVVLNHNRTDT
jgi:hypothetical protein